MDIRDDTMVVDTAIPGDVFGTVSLYPDAPTGICAVAMRDSQLIAISGESLQDLLKEGNLDSWFRRKAEIFRAKVKDLRQFKNNSRLDPFLCLNVGDIDGKTPVLVQNNVTVAEAAKRMAEVNAAVCLVQENGMATGVLTERDILRKIVAKDVDPASIPVDQIMSSPVISVRRDELLFEAFSRMVRGNIRKLVVVDDQGRPERLLEERDMLSVKGENPVYLAGEISRAATLDVLAGVFRKINDMAVRSVAEGIGIFNVGRLVSEMHDHVLLRVCHLVLSGMDQAPPEHFSLLALGSEGRREQYLATDQDNALVYAGKEDSETQAFFAAFGERFSAGLLSIGFPPCPHEVMVKNPVWRMSLSKWMDSIDEMIRKADIDSILRTSLLVDMRFIAGDNELAGKLKSYLFKRVGKNPFLLKYMAREALRFTPPIGFFNNLILEKSGENKGGLDIKKGGVFPITQGVRTLAVELQVLESSTEERIEKLFAQGVFSESMAAGIRESYAFFQTLRVRSQAERQKSGDAPSNFISPDRLSNMDREHLKECFKVVVDFQALLYNKYGLRLLT